MSSPCPDDPERHLPASHSPLPELSGAEAAHPDVAEFHRVRSSDDFQKLRSVFRGFAFPMTVAFLVWYAFYVLASIYLQDFMKIHVFGNVNLGLLLGLMQFATTFLITWLYLRHANKNLDPIATKLRNELEGNA